MNEYSSRESYNEEKDPLGPKLAAWAVVAMIVYLIIAQWLQAGS